MSKRKSYTIDVEKCKTGSVGSYIVFKFNKGRFKDEPIKLSNFRFRDDEGNSEYCFLEFDYVVLSGKKFREAGIKQLEKYISPVVYDLLDVSIEHARRIIDDSVSTNTGQV